MPKINLLKQQNFKVTSKNQEKKGKRIQYFEQGVPDSEINERIL